MIGTDSNTFVAGIEDINSQHSSFLPDKTVIYNAANGITYHVSLMCACRGSYSSLVYGAKIVENEQYGIFKLIERSDSSGQINYLAQPLVLGLD